MSVYLGYDTVTKQYLKSLGGAGSGSTVLLALGGGGTLNGFTMSGDIDMDGNEIVELDDPSTDSSATNRKYVDDKVANVGGFTQAQADNRYGMVWWYGNTLFNDAGPDSNLLVSTGSVKTLTIYKKEKKEEIFTCEYFWCDHNYHLAIISSNNILKLVDRFGYLCVKREAIPQFSPTIIETLFEELSIWFRKG